MAIQDLIINFINEFNNNVYFDEKENMIMCKVDENSVNTIHTSIYKTHNFAHHIEYSIKYAYTLLEQNKEYNDTINSIIEKVLSLQQLSHSESLYGLWPAFMEEPLKMMAFPDPNIATFISKHLMHIYLNHHDILPENILIKIEQSCCAASTFIVNRNCTPFNSHITLSECYTCAMVGELFSKSEFINYSEHKLKKLLYYILTHGDFIDDFNSPRFYISMAIDLTSILNNVQNKTIISTAEHINNILWKGFSSHYHYHTGQLAGPYSRAESLFLSDIQRQIIYNATDSKSGSAKLQCPEEFYSYYNNEKCIEYSQRLISNGALYPYFLAPQVATTYIRPSYSIGSFCRKELWREFKPLLIHFGTKDNPYCSEMQCNINGSSFSSSQLFCLQIKNSVLGHISFSTNHGLHHASDNKNTNGKLDVSDLRIRYVIHGDSSKLKNIQKNNTLLTYYSDLCFKFNYDLCKVSDFTPYVELSRTENAVFFDLIIYKGKCKKIDFSAMKYAICQFSFHVCEKDIIDIPIKNTINSDYIITTMQKDTFEMYVKSPVKPTDWISNFSKNEQRINGTLLEEYAQNNEEYALQYNFIASTSAELPLSHPKDPSDPVNLIISNINSISSLDFDKLQTTCDTIFNIIEKNNISIDIAKRFTLHILTNIIEVANKNLLYEKLLKNEYANIYMALSRNNTIEEIQNTIMSTLQKLKLEHTLLTQSSDKISLTTSIIDIIHNEFSSPTLSLTYLSTKLKKTESHISKTFHHQTGLTYIQYLTRIRMEHAIKLISEGENNYESLANKCGYEYLTSFLRTFKKYTGHTVSEYRKQLLNN